MRLFDEKNNKILDTAHFRFIELDGATLKLYNRAVKEHTIYDDFWIEYETVTEANLKLDELAQEVGWMEFNHLGNRTLVNTFCFKLFKIKDEVDAAGKAKYYNLEFKNGGGDVFRIRYDTYDEVLEDLKKLIL